MTRLLIVTVLLAVVAVVLALRNRKGVATRSLKVTARAGLSRNAAIVVVEVEGRRLLVGAAANSVNVLAELGAATDADAADATAPEDVSASVRSPQLRRPQAAARTPLDRLRSMTTRSFAADARLEDPRGLQ
jgi:flagellar biogenesis protein FliO